MATRLERTYSIRNDKTVAGMATAVADYFRKFKGMDIRVEQKNALTAIVTCRTKPVASTVRGNIKRVTGHDLNLTVSLFQDGDKVTVDYCQEISEGWRTATAIFTSFAGIGIAQLHGIAQRHNIPFELHEVIKNYLS